MIATIASAALIVAASLALGQATLALADRRDVPALAGPVGLALLLAAAAIVAGLGGRGPAIALALGALAVGAGLALLSAPATRQQLAASRPTNLLAPAVAALLAALFAAVPFIAAGQVGILGVGLVNDDMASHLLLADWIDERFRPEPVLIDQGYPLGPHALVAGLARLLGTGPVEAFAGLTLAIPALTALVAYSALDRVPTAARVGAAALVALPYMAAAYLAQEAFKEPLIALFLLAFALLLQGLRRARHGIALGVLAAGTVYVYSFPGLAWLAGVAVIWGLIGLVRGRRLGPAPAIAGVALAALALLVAPELDRLRDFADFRALHPERANEGGLGNLRGQLSPLEALGIWPTTDFRRSATASSVPAVVFYAGALLALAAFALALPRWLRRNGAAVPAALATAAVLYLAALALGTVYTSAKALAIAAPLITLITLGGLLAATGRRQREPAEPGARRPEHVGATGAGSPWRRLRGKDARTPADKDVKPPAEGASRPRRRGAPADTDVRRPATGVTHPRSLALPLLAAAFAIAAAFSSFLVLRQAPVGPVAHAEELAEIRPLVAGEKLLFLGRDNFILHELRGSKPFTHVRNFYDPYFVEPNFELERVGSKFDFDSVTARTLDRFPYVLTTRAAYASGPSPAHEPIATTDSYVLWQRTGAVGDRRPGETGPEPGRVGGCDGRARQLAAFAGPPVVAGFERWSEATIEGGDEATVSLELEPGAWELSLRYDATDPLILTAPGFEHELPANLDFRGEAPYWAAGTIEVAGGGPATIAATVERPPALGRLLGRDSVAHLGSIAATRIGGPRADEANCAAYVDWYQPRDPRERG